MTIAAPVASETVQAGAGRTAGNGERPASLAASAAASDSLTVFEWAFPIVDDTGKGNTLSGSREIPLTSRLERMQPSDASGKATCTWRFSASDKVLPPPTPAPLAPPPFLTSAEAGKTVGDRARAAALTAAPEPASPSEPGATLTAVTPTGPPLAGFVFSDGPGFVQLGWTPIGNYLSSSDANRTNLRLYRTFGSQSPTEIPLARDFYNLPVSGYREEGLDPGAYTFRLRIDYRDGTWGEAVASFVAPPFANPTGFRATFISSDTVKLDWNAPPGALRYRVDGTGIPTVGQEVTGTMLTMSPIRGQASWQISAIYPGNRMDFTNRPVATTVAKPIPSHAPAYLSKSAGPGSESETTAHYTQLCNPDRPYATPCVGLGSYLRSWGAPPDIAQGSGESQAVKYNNVTDLGVPRQTLCFYSEPGSRGGALVCYANTDQTVSLIVMRPEGARFAVFRAPAPDPSGYGAGWTDSVPLWTTQFDSEGQKSVPHACLSCHGGRYDSATQLVKDASLLPIDPSLVQVIGDSPATQEKIRRFNSMIHQTYSTPAVALYIDGLYGGLDGNAHLVDRPGTRAIADFAPSGWATQRNLYLDFVKKDCAMCHLAGPGNLNFLTAGNFLNNKDLVYAAVCRARSMPHAETSFINFWASGSGAASGPGWFATVLGFQGCPSP